MYFHFKVIGILVSLVLFAWEYGKVYMYREGKQFSQRQIDEFEPINSVYCLTLHIFPFSPSFLCGMNLSVYNTGQI